MGKPFDAELKAAFLAAVKVHLAKGWSTNSAYQQAKAEFQQEGKPVPDQWTCRRWLAAEGVFPRTRRTGRTSRTCRTNADGDGAGETDEVAGAEDEAAEESTESIPSTESTPGAYVRKLEAMLRLYRRRTEADVDAVCDCLLPGLFPAEEE